jgi:DNA invertase Pin-like site-specific DNA recombinase
MRVLAYLRVSTSGQAQSGAGLQAQRAAIRAEAMRRGWSEVTFIEDSGWSAKDMKRPGLTNALAMLKGKEADALASGIIRLSPIGSE